MDKFYLRLSFLLSFIFVSLSSICVFGQESQNFAGKWTGYIKFSDKPLYSISADFTSIESKKISGQIKVCDFKDSSIVFKMDHVSLEYDKQKKIAFYNTGMPNSIRRECVGWFIIKISEHNAEELEVKFRTDGECMKAEFRMARSTVMSSDSVFARAKTGEGGGSTIAKSGGSSSSGVSADPGIRPDPRQGSESKSTRPDILSTTTSPSSEKIKPGSVLPSTIELKADILEPFHEGFAIIKRGTETALVNKKAEFSIPYGKFLRIAYDEAEAGTKFHYSKMYGVWTASGKKEESSLIDPTGKQYYTVKLPVSLIAIGDGLPGVRVVQSDGSHYWDINRLWLYKNSFIKNLEGAPEVKLVDEGIVAYKDKGNPKKWGFRYINGAVIVPPIFDEVDRFCEGLAAVAKKDEYGELKWGFIDKSGKEVIPFTYSIQPGEFGNGLACVIPKDKTEFQFALINKKGQIVLKIPPGADFRLLSDRSPLQFYRDPLVFKNGLMLGRGSVYSESVFLDTSGNVVSFGKLAGLELKQYKSIKVVEIKDDQMIFTHSEGGMGVMNITTRKVTPPVFMSVTTFDPVSGLAYAEFKVVGNGPGGYTIRRGYINQDGLFVIVQAAPDKF